jgi:hypothetical protein
MEKSITIFNDFKLLLILASPISFSRLTFPHFPKSLTRIPIFTAAKQRDLLAWYAEKQNSKALFTPTFSIKNRLPVLTWRPCSHCSSRGRWHEAEGAARLVLPGAEQQGRILNSGGAWEGCQARQAHHAGKIRTVKVPFLWIKIFEGERADTTSRFVSFKAFAFETFLKRLQSAGWLFVFEGLLKCGVGFRGVAPATPRSVLLQNSPLAEKISALSVSLTSLISDGCVEPNLRSILIRPRKNYPI